MLPTTDNSMVGDVTGVTGLLLATEESTKFEDFMHSAISGVQNIQSI